MKQLICIYCEGNDTKLAVIEKEGEGRKPSVLKTASVSLIKSSTQLEENATGFRIEGESLDVDGLDESASIKSDLDSSSISEISNALKGFNLAKYSFIPALTEPAIYYHLFEGARPPKPAKLKQEIMNDILETKNISVDKESIDYIELSDKALLSVFVVGDIRCIDLVNSLARQRALKFPRLKVLIFRLRIMLQSEKSFSRMITP